MNIDKQTLDSVLCYEPETGIFRYLKPRGSMKVGDVAGTSTKSGYVRINVLGELHYAHRLAWLTTKGSMPNAVIDHINGDPTDNRIVNLRDVSHAENLQNQFRPTRDNPYLGVSHVRGKWQSTVTRFGLSLHLGVFNTAEEASLAYQQSKQMTHEQFQKLARSKRRANRLALELTYLLRDFPGFTSTPEQQAAWSARRLHAIT